jgi:hypothetical protein
MAYLLVTPDQKKNSYDFKMSILDDCATRTARSPSLPFWVKGSIHSGGASHSPALAEKKESRLREKKRMRSR